MDSPDACLGNERHSQLGSPQPFPKSEYTESPPSYYTTLHTNVCLWGAVEYYLPSLTGRLLPAETEELEAHALTWGKGVTLHSHLPSML